MSLRVKSEDERREEYFATLAPYAVHVQGTPVFVVSEDPANALDQELMPATWFESPGATWKGEPVNDHDALRAFLARQWSGYPGPEGPEALARALRGTSAAPEALRWVRAFFREVGDRGLGAEELYAVMADEGMSVAEMACAVRRAGCTRGLVVNALNRWATRPGCDEEQDA